MTIESAAPSGGRSPGVAALAPDVSEATRIARNLANAGQGDAQALAEQLYGTWYARGSSAADDHADPPADQPSDLVAVLRAAHAAASRWEDGWIVERVGPAGKVAAERDGERRVLYRSDYLGPGRTCLVAAIGDRVVATARRDLVDPDGAWWRTRGRAWSEAAPPADLIRLYWNVALGELPRLFERLTTVLDRLDRPWMVKCAVDPAHHVRPDAVVAYLRRTDVLALRSEIDAVRLAAEVGARAGHPPFTLPVGPGLAVAADPGRHLSFGEHRCRLVADGVLASVAGDSSALLDALSAAMDAVAERFSAEGFDPRRPWAAGPALLPWERA